MTQEQALNKIIDCWQFAPKLGKETFLADKLAQLPKSINVLNYTDTSILFTFNGRKLFGFYDWVINGWSFKQ